MRFVLTFLILAAFPWRLLAADCDRFVSWVAPAKKAYFEKHRIYPIPEQIQALAIQYLPQLWVHPNSWQPIDFDDYLAQSKLIRHSDKQVVMTAPSVAALKTLDDKQQCGLFLEAGAVPPKNPAPVYIQAFSDHNPVDPDDHWIYIKYNLVFDWSGLAAKIGWLSRLGAWLAGGRIDRWHRLDVHLAVILAFDDRHRLRLLTLAQHNHQQTYLPGIDFAHHQRPHLAAAFRSNELYLDNGASHPVSYRVVPFFSDVAYLIDPSQRPIFWGEDVVYGRNAGGQEVQLAPVFIEPGHPLADFAGLLGPPRRLMGRYIGRDGPPGYNYYAPPDYVPMSDFAAMGYWRAGDLDLLTDLQDVLSKTDDFERIDWRAMLELMRNRLRQAQQNQIGLPNYGISIAPMS